MTISAAGGACDGVRSLEKVFFGRRRWVCTRLPVGPVAREVARAVDESGSRGSRNEGMASGVVTRHGE